MRNCKELFNEIITRLVATDGKGETQMQAYILLEDCFGINRSQVLAGADVAWNQEQQQRLDNVIVRLNKGEPVQYIAGQAYFYGRIFLVSPGVLIPRPETEELVQEVIRYAAGSVQPLRILDIGTGSGCIPVTLAAEIESATIMATDVSEDALAVAARNIVAHKVAVQLLQHNILTQSIPFTDLDVLVSNPPYVGREELHAMSINVVNYEPHLALFVPDDDVLIFYRVIAEKAKSALRDGGLLVFEINERYGEEVGDLLKRVGYTAVQILNDLSGKQRIVKGIR